MFYQTNIVRCNRMSNLSQFMLRDRPKSNVTHDYGDLPSSLILRYILALFLYLHLGFYDQ